MAERAAKDSLWEQLAAALAQMQLKFPLYELALSIDANARVGSIPSEAIGHSYKQTENDNGSRLRHFLEGSSLAAANTWFNIAWTWMSTRRTVCRIDYDCMRRAALPRVQNAFTDTDVPLNMDGSDDEGKV